MSISFTTIQSPHLKGAHLKTIQAVVFLKRELGFNIHVMYVSFFLPTFTKTCGQLQIVVPRDRWLVWPCMVLLSMYSCTCMSMMYMHIPSQSPPSHQPLCLQCLVVAAGRLAKKDLFGLWYMYMYTVMYKLLNLPGTHVLHVGCSLRSPVTLPCFDE